MSRPLYKVEISHKTVIFTVLFLLGLYVLFLISDIVLGLFIAVMLMTALNPLVANMEKLRVPRLLAIWITYVLLILLITGAVAIIIPPLVSQTLSLVNALPLDQLGQMVKSYNLSLDDLPAITSQLGSLPKILSVVTSTFSTVVSVVALLVLTFYLLVEREHVHVHLKWLFGNDEAEKKAENFVNQVELSIGRWVRGEILLMIVIGVMTYIGLLLLNIPYALPLAILAGLLEILPNIGPTVSAIPAILVAYFTISPIMAGAVTALYIIVQQVENNFIVPFIMKSAVGINPIITIVLLLIGYRLNGVAGAALAIPIFLVVKVVATEFYKVKKNNP